MAGLIDNGLTSNSVRDRLGPKIEIRCSVPTEILSPVRDLLA